MKYDEYVSKINGVLAEPDTALTSVTGVLDELKADLTSKETLEAENETLKKRISDLQDTNMKLYLSITGTETNSDEDDEPVEGVGVIDEFLGIAFKESEDK